MSSTMKCQTLHWSAGTGREEFDEYHGNVKCGGAEDGKYVRKRSDSVKGAHTWGRNTGNGGKAFLAEADAHPEADGHGGIKPVGSKFPITAKAIETMAKAVAEDCCYHGIPLLGIYSGPEYVRRNPDTPNDRLEPTGRTLDHLPTVSDHAFYARIDQYPGDRWDIADVLPVVMHKAEWYIEQIKSGAQNYEHTRKGTYASPGPEYWSEPA